MHFLNNKNILLLGGSGFVGKSITKILLDSGYRVVVITRNLNKIKSLKVSAEPGQLEIISANIFEDGVLKENIKNKFAVINLCGILYESNRDDFYKLHTFLPGYISKICRKNDVSRFIHVSALGVSKNSKSIYSRTKAAGERKVLKKNKTAIILRPSIIYGNGDNFFGQFAKMSSISPILPLIGSNTKFQPLYVNDLALSVLNLLENGNKDNIYELGGPKIYTFEELLKLMLKIMNRRRILIKLNPRLMTIPGYFLNYLPKPPFTSDQMKLLLSDNVVNNKLPGFKELNVKPTNLETVLPNLLKFYIS